MNQEAFYGNRNRISPKKKKPHHHLAPTQKQREQWVKSTVVPNPGSWQAEWRPKNNSLAQKNHHLLINHFPKNPSPSELLPANAPILRMLHHPFKLPCIGNWTLNPQIARHPNCKICSTNLRRQFLYAFERHCANCDFFLLLLLSSIQRRVCSKESASLIR